MDHRLFPAMLTRVFLWENLVQLPRSATECRRGGRIFRIARCKQSSSGSTRARRTIELQTIQERTREAITHSPDSSDSCDDGVFLWCVRSGWELTEASEVGVVFEGRRPTAWQILCYLPQRGWRSSESVVHGFIWIFDEGGEAWCCGETGKFQGKSPASENGRRTSFRQEDAPKQEVDTVTGADRDSPAMDRPGSKKELGGGLDFTSMGNDEQLPKETPLG